jgi:gliding motility-associated-like protein
MSQAFNDDCTGALYLCPEVIYQANNIGATSSVCAGCEDGSTAAGNSCFEIDNTVWFSFQTNNIGGTAIVELSNISCLSGTDQNQNIQAVIIEAGTACDESTYVDVSNCESAGSGSVSLMAAALNPNSTYYIQVDGALGANTLAAECDFEISVSGEAVETIIETSTTDATCGNSDGAISVDNIFSGSGSYTYSLDGVGFQGSSQFQNLPGGSYTITIEDGNGCTYVETGVDVINSDGPNDGSVVVTHSTCSGSTGEINITNITNGQPPYTYLQNGQNSVPMPATGVSAGVHFIVVTDANGCEYTYENIIVEVVGGISDAQIIIDNPNCGESNGSITVNPVGGTAPYSYNIAGLGQQTSNVFENLGAGSYNLIITDANSCQFNVLAILLEEEQGILSPSVDLVLTPDPVCEGEPATVTAVPTNGGTNPNYEFFLNGASVQNGNASSYSGTFSAGDELYVIITSDADCLGTDQAQSNLITFDPVPSETPSTQETVVSTDICFDENGTIQANSTGCTDGYFYTWYVNGLIAQQGEDSLFSMPLDDGAQVYYDVQCATGCGGVTSSPISNFTVSTPEADAGPDQILIEGNSTILFGTGVGDPTWSPGTNLSSVSVFDPTASPGETITYTLTTELNGCTATDEVIIYVEDPIVPFTGLSPNGDGINDTWTIINIDAFENNQVIIYDRWGQKLYSKTSYSNSNGWDGTIDGRFLPEGAYYYYIDLKAGENGIFTGVINIAY